MQNSSSLALFTGNQYFLRVYLGTYLKINKNRQVTSTLLPNPGSKLPELSILKKCIDHCGSKQKEKYGFCMIVETEEKIRN